MLNLFRLTRQGANIASAASITVPDEGDYFLVTGTTNISGITASNRSAGARVYLRFEGVLTLVNGPGLILADGTNHQTIAGEVFVFAHEGAGIWREIVRSAWNPDPPLHEFAEDAAVVSSVETTILTYTVGVGKTLFVQGFDYTGTAAGRFKLKVGATTKGVGRTSAAEPAGRRDFAGGALEVAAGGVVTITGYHTELANQTMSVTLFGYLL